MTLYTVATWDDRYDVATTREYTSKLAALKAAVTSARGARRTTTQHPDELARWFISESNGGGVAVWSDTDYEAWLDSLTQQQEMTEDEEMAFEARCLAAWERAAYA